MKVRERIDRLREYMKLHCIDACVIPTADYHQSEYVGEHFKLREYLTGFTGSAGTAVFTAKEAGLWTDGRYFIQAEEQLKGTGICLYRMGEPSVPGMEEFLRKVLPEQGTLGFDGRTIGVKEGKRLEELVREKRGKILYEIDPAEAIWESRPPLSEKPAFLLDTQYAGEEAEKKLACVRKAMEEKGADIHILTTLDDIGWLLNIRGQDVKYFPLLLSYLIVKKTSVELYADERKFSEEIKRKFAASHIEVFPYNQIYDRVKQIKARAVLLDTDRTNYTLYQNLPGNVKVICEENPEILMKSVKNQTEIDNIRRAHLKDGIAHTKFMYWIKNCAEPDTLTELEVSDKLEEFRSRQEGFLQPSFEPICAFGEHGAIVHYSADENTNARLQKGGLLLTDTGGNYYEGSTDITRTVAIGEIHLNLKNHFTLVAASMLRLADARFLYGCSGGNLDYAAREPFWRENMNFNHGTGHGVGYLGNIHEPPIGFRWKFSESDRHPLEENMVITDEPGIYIEGSHGIRLENELLVRSGEKNEYGQFMYFETLTFVPIDLDAINPEKLDVRERELLNSYHREVYKKIGPYLTEAERDWLREYTRPI